MEKIIQIKVFPRSKKNAYKIENGIIKVYLTAPAVEGKANKALIQFLSKHFQVKKNQFEIIKGLKSREKTIKIFDI